MEMTLIGRVRALRRDILAEYFDDCNIIMVNHLREEIKRAIHMEKEYQSTREDERYLKRTEKILKELFNRRAFLKNRSKTKWKKAKSTDRKIEAQRKNNKKAYIDSLNRKYFEIMMEFARENPQIREKIETYFQNQKLHNKKKNRGKGQDREYELNPLFESLESDITLNKISEGKMDISTFNKLKNTLKKEREDRRVEEVITEEREFKKGLLVYKKETKRLKFENKGKPRKERIYATIDYDLKHIFDHKGLNTMSATQIDQLIASNTSENSKKPVGVRILEA
jgi:hypothetical protein